MCQHADIHCSPKGLILEEKENTFWNLPVEPNFLSLNILLAIWDTKTKEYTSVSGEKEGYSVPQHQQFCEII